MNTLNTLQAMYKSVNKAFEITGEQGIVGFVMHPAVADALIRELEAQYVGSWNGLGFYINRYIPADRMIAFGPDGKVVAILEIQHDDANSG